MNGSIRKAALVAPALLFLTIPTVQAQDAQQIAARAWEKHKERAAGVDNYWLKQKMMGFENVVYFEKQMIDGEPVFVMSNEYGGDEQDMSEMYHNFLKYADRAKLEGMEEIDGHSSYMLYIDDFTGMLDEEDSEDFTPKKGTFYLDEDEYVLRKLIMDGEMESNGQTQPVHAEMTFSDYRDISGMLIPFLTTMEMSGLQGNMSEEDIEEARAQLAKMKQQLESMPEAQRNMVEPMLKEQMAKLEEMVNSGTLTMTIEVIEAKANEGQPGAAN